jgi:hypothetical protein
VAIVIEQQERRRCCEPASVRRIKVIVIDPGMAETIRSIGKGALKKTSFILSREISKAINNIPDTVPC